jgi:hypothetical protein
MVYSILDARNYGVGVEFFQKDVLAILHNILAV